MKKILAISLLFVISIFNTVICQKAEWVERIGGDGSDYAKSTAIDKDGNVFVIGQFYSDVLNFNNGKSITNSGYRDSFIAKYNSSGTCQWVEKIAGASNNDDIQDIVLDSDGNLYVVGYFSSSVLEFNSGKSLSNTGDDDGLIAKYNGGGTCQWAERISGSQKDFVKSIILDSDRNIYVIGDFMSSSLSFNNGKVLSNDGIWDGFIARYNNSGICEWAEKIGGTSYDHCNGITIDSDGIIYVAGDYHSNTLDFNNGKSLDNSGSTEAFLARYNKNGICEWAEKFAGQYDDYAMCVATSKDGDIYVAGYFSSPTFDFNNGKMLINTGEMDGFVAKYNRTGICEWAEKIAGSSREYVQCIAVDKDNSVYVAGDFFSDAINFNNGMSLSKTAETDGFVAKYNRSGTCEWAEKVAGLYGDYVYGISVDNKNNMYFTGTYYSSLLIFNNGKSLELIGNTSDIYLAKYGQIGTSVADNSSINDNLSLKIFPNPTSANIEISLTTSDCSNTTLKLYDMSGRLARDLSRELTNSNSQSLSVNLSTLTSGEYTIILTCGNEKISKSVVVVR